MLAERSRRVFRLLRTTPGMCNSMPGVYFFMQPKLTPQQIEQLKRKRERADNWSFLLSFLPIIAVICSPALLLAAGFAACMAFAGLLFGGLFKLSIEFIRGTSECDPSIYKRTK